MKKLLKVWINFHTFLYLRNGIILFLWKRILLYFCACTLRCLSDCKHMLVSFASSPNHFHYRWSSQIKIQKIRCSAPRCSSDALHHGCSTCPAVQTPHPFSLSLFMFQLKRKCLLHTLVSVKELPFGTPPLTFASSGRAPIGGEAEKPLKFRRNRI